MSNTKACATQNFYQYLIKSINVLNYVFTFALLQVCFFECSSQSITKKPFKTTNYTALRNIEVLPILYSIGTQSKQFAAYDAGGANSDGSFRSAYVRYVDKNGEYVIFDASGPGCLTRQQYNVWSHDRFKDAGAKSRIKYYFDDEPTPRIDLLIDDFFGGRTAPFLYPLTLLDTIKRFGNVYYPLFFKKRLKVTTTLNLDSMKQTNGKIDPLGYDNAWYQYTYHIFSKNANVQSYDSRNHENENTILKEWASQGEDPKSKRGDILISKIVNIAAGKTVTAANIKGAGALSSIKINLNPYNQQTFYHTWIRIYWDDMRNPAVDMPIGNFFGGGGENYSSVGDITGLELKTLMYGFDGKNHQFYMFWPMPFWKQARVEIWNDTKEDLDDLKLDIQYKPSSVYTYKKALTGYFYAKRTVAKDKGKDLYATVFQEQGRGHVVGLTFFSDKYAMDGDEFTYIDGQRSPTIHGSGTEDDHGQGWGGSNYQTPIWGGLVNGYQGAYRLYIDDSYVFNHDITINYEYSREGGNAYGGKVDAVLYYYKTAASNLFLSDAIDVGDRNSEKKHHYRINGKTVFLDKLSGYDGYERNYTFDALRDNGYAYNGYSEFTANIDSANEGLKLRRRIYRTGNGIQRANVFVNGQLVQERQWDIVTLSSASSYQSWFDDDFEIPAAYTQGQRSVKIKIEYIKGDGSSNDINEFYYWVFNYTRSGGRVKNAALSNLTAVNKGPFKNTVSWRIDHTPNEYQYYKIYRSMSPAFEIPILAGTSDQPTFNDTWVQPNTRYYYKVAVVKPTEAEHMTNGAATVKTAPIDAPSVAKFITVDDISMGNWDSYGKDGFAMPQNFYGHSSQAYPEYVSEIKYGDLRGHQFASWENHSPSSLSSTAINYKRKFLGGLETPTNDRIEVYINDNVKHQVALYFCDLDKKDRAEDIEIADTKGKVLVPKIALSNFEKGKWLVYDFIGSFTIVINNKNPGASAVISALMFDTK